MKNHKNFSFDVGMTSLGVAVNENGQIVHGDVLLMHADAGSVRAESERRRMFRTREAHKARETVLESLWRSIGKEPLQRKSFRKTKSQTGRSTFVKTKADERLEREFPAKGDSTVYASSLLRVMLIEGQKLEDWQIYKALHAGIQRRGYDKNVPWKAREEAREKEKKQKTDKDENPEKQIDRFNEYLQKMTPDKRYHLPCYYDAWKMGLWNNQTKEITDIRQKLRPKAEEGKYVARGYNASRELVTREINCLLDRATEQIPELKKHLAKDKREQLLYGEQRNALDKHYPSATKISGLLGQKYPRFENRIVSKCAVIPRLNVCKAEKKLAIEVGFLLRLVNWRYERVDEHGNKSAALLTGKDLTSEFKKCEDTWKKKAKKYAPEEYAKCFKLTKSKVSKMAERLGGGVKTGHEEIPGSKHTGRSRFSQPSLYLLKHLILSEKTPKYFYEELLQSVATEKSKNPNAEFGYNVFTDVSYKYFSGDFAFLEKMGDSRDAIHIPDISLAERYINENGDVESAIRRVIKSCNWPELRHRLNVFRHELESLVEQYGKPDAVHLEFIREDFLSEKKKKKYEQQSKEGSDANKEAIKALKKGRISVSDKNILRYRLYKEQNKQCLYTGASIDPSVLESYDLDHIFPKEDGGPDAYYNKALTSANVNRKKKGKRLPCECDFINWAAFKTRLGSLSLGGNKKKLLLASTREEAEVLIDKYTGLSGTAHIARLARDIVCLQFGWQPGEEGEQQRIFVFSGGLTSKVSKKHKLYQALGDGSKHYQKDRSDHRHHALDAMVISYLSQWARDKNKTDFFKLPDDINAEYFAEKLADVYPHYITRTRPALAEKPQQKKYKGKEKKKLNRTESKNISKDPDEHGGQWYTNKSESGKGTYQHGYLFYKDKQGNINSKTIHSFRSPYAVQKEVEKKAAEILGLFYQGKSIYLPDQDKITATQLGRDARLKFGDYEVVKINKGKVIIGEADKQQDQGKDDGLPGRYRIPLTDLKKISVCNELIRGKSFELDEFSVSKDKMLTGSYKMDNNNVFGLRDVIIINTQTDDKESVNFRSLVKYLSEKDWTRVFQEKDIIAIKNIHANYIKKVTTDNLPEQKLLDGNYLIRGFETAGKTVNLIAQNGTVYRIDRKILAYAEQPA